MKLALQIAYDDYQGCRERQRQGVNDPRTPEGRDCFSEKAPSLRGRKRALTAEQIAELQKRAEYGESKATLSRDFDINRDTVYQ